MLSLLRFGLVVLALVFALLLQLPGKMASDYFVGWLTQQTANWLGFEMPGVETFARDAWFVAPFFAVGAVLYLYHLCYEKIAKYTSHANLIVASSQKKISIGQIFGSIISGAALIGFIVIVLIGGYRTRVPASEHLKFSDLSRISNYDLRERAFQVSRNLRLLNRVYVNRQDEINSQYKKQMAAWKAVSSDYATKLKSYNDYLNSSSGYPLFSDTLLGLTEAAKDANGQFNLLAPAARGLPPPYPSPPGDQPQPAVVTVDDAWFTKMSAAQEEASAVWAEMHYRLGGYAPLFVVPRTYNSPDVFKLDIGKIADDIENEANNLH